MYFDCPRGDADMSEYKQYHRGLETELTLEPESTEGRLELATWIQPDGFTAKKNFSSELNKAQSCVFQNVQNRIQNHPANQEPESS